MYIYIYIHIHIHNINSSSWTFSKMELPPVIHPARRRDGLLERALQGVEAKTLRNTRLQSDGFHHPSGSKIDIMG